jgi:hypothetical protein
MVFHQNLTGSNGSRPFRVVRVRELGFLLLCP